MPVRRPQLRHRECYGEKLPTLFPSRAIWLVPFWQASFQGDKISTKGGQESALDADNGPIQIFEVY